jgi:hypothetical protein
MLALHEASPAARLLIDAAGAEAMPRGLATLLWQRLRAGLQHGDGPQPDGATLEIDDLQGRRVLSLHGAQPPLEVALPAGTYHVHVRRGALRRRYTVTLESGALFRLCVGG